MIIGENKGKVIDNIKQATEEKEYNVKVEVNDPEVTNSEKKEIINKYLVNKRKISYKAKNELARVTVDIAMWMENRGTVIKGIEKVEHINLKGFKYELKNGTLAMGSSLGISNEISKEEAIIEFDNGILIMINSKD